MKRGTAKTWTSSTRTGPLPEAAKGRRIYLVARLGAKLYASFHIDLVVGTAMSGEPDLVEPITSIDIAGLIRPRYRAFPVVDHISDKLIATVESHQSAGEVRPSSRVKDLVDLALIARTQVVGGPELRRAIRIGSLTAGSPCRTDSRCRTRRAGGHVIHGWPETRPAWCRATTRRSNSRLDCWIRPSAARSQVGGVPATSPGLDAGLPSRA
jgi:hypothetical protein